MIAPSPRSNNRGEAPRRQQQNKHQQQKKEEEVDNVLAQRRDLTVGLIRVVTTLVIFTTGFVVGLSLGTASFTMYYPYTSFSQAEIFFPKTIRQSSACDDEYCLGIKHFIKPKKLEHSMTDEELFWRASMVPTMPDYPYRRTPRIAFVFLVRGPLPLAPLWERFFHGHEEHFNIYVHTLPNHNLNVSEGSAFYGRQIPSKHVSWGSVSLLDAEKRLLANALLDFSNERFVLLSESCIPVFDFRTVYSYLIGSADCFVDSYDEDSPRGRGRYSRHMYPDIRPSQWRKGSQWFEVDRKVAVAVIAESYYYDIFKKYCKPSCYPDEHYIPTYLNMFHSGLNSNRSVTWVDWSRGGPHPATFGAENITESFLRSIQNNGTTCTYNGKTISICYLFARKFSPTALEALLSLSSTVMRY